MSDNPIQQAPQDDSNAQYKKTKGKNIKGAETKHEVGKRVISGTFGGFITLVAFSVHDWTFWAFITPGLGCLAFCLFLELKHLGYKKSPARNWALILFAGGLLVGLTYWLRDNPIHPLPTIPAEPASVSLELGPNLDPKDPFGQGFIIFNQGKQTISNVWAIASWTNPSVKIYGVFSLISSISPKIISSGKQGLHITRQDSSSPENVFPPFGSRTFVNVDVRYTPDFPPRETNHIFQFCVAQTRAGEFVWIPTGEGESLKDIRARTKQQPHRIIDVAPFITLGISSIEYLPQTNQTRLLKINCSWTNVGALSADRIFINWAIEDNRSGEAMIPMSEVQDFMFGASPHTWPDQSPEKILMPGDSESESVVFPEPVPQNIFDGIMSGNLWLIGRVHFKDTVGHIYGIQWSCVYTNNEFQIGWDNDAGFFNILTRTNDQFILVH
jgi:hypothetical protein